VVKVVCQAVLLLYMTVHSLGCASVYPCVIHASLGSPKSKSQTASRSVQLFCAAYDRLLSGTSGHAATKNCPFLQGTLDLHLIHGSLGPPESLTEMASRSVQPFCRAHYCDRETDRLCHLVYNSKPHLRM